MMILTIDSDDYINFWEREKKELNICTTILFINHLAEANKSDFIF